ncbi:fungal specific transcription factor domain-containing protein [Diplodia corticola]|uniref:Fungal specific transcription factor domain-containing protein n=1 Tax=Diplodia corticola TaxID=236234 RepID=A0A1J9QZR2_9PEZI|nr:fungal specific transcription factor domain-containing protein [Diplodia corticola]OJD33857.1 fungal specific transcription factor domain-containing protein [Diplodia corticola]
MASTTDAPGNATSFLGENSAASYLRQMGGAESHIARDIVPALGLRNTRAQYPFINAETDDEKSRELAKVLPTHGEILSFYHVYRAIAFPLAPLIVDIEDFESRLADYLEKLAGSTPTRLVVTNEREEAARIALLLATLAAGAQYSERDAQERRRISRDFARRSFHALRLANFLLRPLLTSLQALLILGTFLQNDGNADAAWAMSGTTMRLAQSLGLHSEYGTAENIPDKEKVTRSKLWLTIAQQDCVLSLCFDRPTALAYMPFVSCDTIGSHQPNNFQQVMWDMSKIGLRLLARRTSSDANIENILEKLQELDQVMVQAAPHLRNKSDCTTLQEKVQHFLVSQHRSFAISAVCRPTFKKLQRIDNDSTFLHILSTGKNALAQTVKSFLDLHSMSVYPTRSWTSIHEALSSALLLTILGETRKSSTLANMQKRLIHVLLSRAQDDSPGKMNNALTSSHLNALKALQRLMQEASERPRMGSVISQQEPRDPALAFPADSTVPSSDGLGVAATDPAFDFLQSDLSPMAFLDSIIWDRSLSEDDTAFLGFEFGD